MLHRKKYTLTILILLATLQSPVFALALSATPTTGGTTGGGTTVGGFNGDITIGESDSLGSGLSGGGLAACSTEILKGTVVAGALTALGITDRVVGVGTAESANALGQIFTSSTGFLDFINQNCLDPMAREYFKKMLAQSENSTLKFVAGGLNGSTFPTDLNEYFTQIKDTALNGWLADIDTTSPFAADIKNAVYVQKRSQDNGYTPDLAENIFAAQCKEYERRQVKPSINTEATKSNTGFINEVSRNIRNVFETAENRTLPNNRGFKVQGALPIQNTFSFGQAFIAQKAYAQTTDFECRITTKTGIFGTSARTFIIGGIQNSTACRAEAAKYASPGTDASYVFVDRTAVGINSAAVSGTIKGGTVASSTPLELSNANPGTTSENPCKRPMATAADKQAVIDNYNSKNAYPVAPIEKWAIVSKSLQCKNMSTCATQVALVSKNAAEQNAQQLEQQTLANNNGNTGARECLSYLPQSDEERVRGVSRSCAKEIIVTPGSVLSSKTNESLKVSTANLLNQATGGTFKDFINSALNGLLSKATSQLYGKGGLTSFGNRSKSNQGAFTSGVSNLDRTSVVGTADTKSISTSIANTESYISTLTQNKETLDGIIKGVGQVKALCSEILTLKEKRVTSGRGVIEDLLNDANDSCNIDPAGQNYTKDPSAGARLAANPIYIESRALESTKSERDQLIISIKNAAATKKDIQSSRADYQEDSSLDRDAALLRSLGSIAGRIPEGDSINTAGSNSQSLTSRLQIIEQTIVELEERLKSLK